MTWGYRAMGYVERKVRAGKTIEIERYYSPRHYPRGERRRRREKLTTEQQRKVNSRLRAKKLRWLLNCNFGYGDYHLDMGYVRNMLEEPRSAVQMKRDADVFLRKLRALYKKHGAELKWIHIMEIGKRGARHHHFVINRCDGVSASEIQRVWDGVYEGRSMIHFSPLDISGNYGQLSDYLIKYTDAHMDQPDGLMKRAYRSSRNLKKPVMEKRIITRREVLQEPNRVRGYYIDKNSVQRGNYAPEYGGFEFLRYILVRLE